MYENLKNNKVAKKYGDQESPKIMDYRELDDYCCSNTNPKKGGIGFVLSKNVRLKASKSYEHVCILGPTGAGKSTSFFIPCLAEADGTHSFVVTDPKGELYHKTGLYLESKGIRVIKLEPLNPKANQYYYNPLLIAEDNTQIRELSQLILINGAKAVELASGNSGGGEGQSEWINMAVPLFTASLAYFKEFGKKKTVNEAIDFLLREDDLNVMEETFSKSKNALNNFRMFKTSSGSEKTLSSIKSVLKSNIQLFLDEKIEEFTKTPFNLDISTGRIVIDEAKLFDPKMLREKPTALFVCVPEVKSDYMSPLMSVFYSQLLNNNMQYFNINGSYNTPILYLLDEFANIGLIPGISRLTAICRSRKMGISIGIQSIEQLTRIYGKYDAHILLNNLKAKVIFSGLVGESAKYVSDLTGITYTSNKIDNISCRINDFSKRNLFSPDEIRQLDKNKILIILDNKQPVIDDKNAYYLSKKYICRVREYD